MLEHIAPRGQRLRRKVMSGPRDKGMIAPRAGDAALRSADHRRALVIRLVTPRAIAEIAFASGPGALEFGAVALRIVARQEIALLGDALGDEMLGDFAEHLLALE